MTTDHDHDNDHDHDRDHKHDNDNKRRDIAAPAKGALTSLTALAAALNAVDTTSLVGSGKPMLLFKREGDGSWMFGQRKIIPETGSHWGVNPLSFKRGYVCFSDGNEKLGEQLLPVTLPMPAVEDLPDKGFPWVEQWSVDLKCFSGADAGVEVTFKSNTAGGIQAVRGLIGEVRDRLNGGQHDGKVSPIVQLLKDSYPHRKYGRVWFPIFDILDWMSIDGPAPAPTPAPTPPPPAEQPRRRQRFG